MNVESIKRNAADVLLDPEVTSFYVFAKYVDGHTYRTAAGTPEFLCLAGGIASLAGAREMSESEKFLPMKDSLDG